MYLWVVLATFLAALAAYVLPLRSDMTNVVDTPVAQAMMMKMVVKHKAGREYMLVNTWPHWCDGAVSSATEPAKQQCAHLSKTGCNNGILADNLLDRASCPTCLPLGFVNDASYRNVIQCVCNTGTESAPVYKSTASCNSGCSQADGSISPTLRALLTYGPIPKRWLVKDGDWWKPSGDLSTAMRKHFGSSQIAGYLVQKSGAYYVRNYEGSDFLIPTQFEHYLDAQCNTSPCFAYLSWNN